MERSHALLRGSVSRRGFLRGATIGGVGLATAAVIGCGDDDDDAAPAPVATATAAAATPAPTAAPTEAPKTLYLKNGASGQPPSLDPSSTAASDDIFWGIYDAPTRLGRDRNVEPHLAESWELDQPNLEWIFNLTEAEWSDGTKMTAADVKFSHDYYGNPDNGSRLISRVGTVESTRVIDDQTVAIKTKALDPIMPRRAMFVLTIPKHIFEDPARGPAHQAQNGVGTGSYIVDDFLDARTDLSASGSSWHGNAGVTRITAFQIPEQTTRIAAFETNAIDLVAAIPTIEADRVSGFPDVTVSGGSSTSQLGWDIEYFEGPTSDVRVRLAICHSLDVPTIVDTIWSGRTKPMRGQIAPEGIFGFTDRLDAYGYDPDESRRLLADAGFPNGFDIDFEFVSPYQPETRPFAEASAGFLNEVGIGTSVIPVELNVWRDGLYGNKKRAPIHYSPWSCFAAEVSFAMTWYRKSNPGKFYDNPQWEAAHDAAVSEIDDEKRRQLYGDASVVAFSDPPAMWTLESIGLTGWRPSILDWSPRVYPFIEYDTVEPA